MPENLVAVALWVLFCAFWARIAGRPLVGYMGFPGGSAAVVAYFMSRYGLVGMGGLFTCLRGEDGSAVRTEVLRDGFLSALSETTATVGLT